MTERGGEPAGRVALVTGGAVRVGGALSRALAREGMSVVVHHHSSSDEADALVQEVRAAGGRAAAVGADLSGPGAAERLAREAEAAFGRVDVLVNSASVFPAETLEETDEALWDRTLAVNLRAPFLLTRHLAAGMRRRGGGVVVNVADLAGVQAWRTHAAHGVAKAGLIHLTRVAARQLGPEVRVACVVPGTVLPPEGTPDDELRRLAERAPLRRIGEPSDVAGAVLYLLRAPFVTGEVLFVDGGRHVV